MQLTLSNLKPWLKATGYRPSDWCGPHMVRALLDDAPKCDHCGDRFTTKADLQSDWNDDQLCDECFDEAREWDGFDAVREWGPVVL